MKTSRLPLGGLIVLLAIGSVNMAAAQKWIPRNNEPRQELDSLTMAASSGNASAQGRNNPPRVVVQESPNHEQVGGWRWIAVPTEGKWAKVKNRMSRVAVGLTRAAQDTGYLPPPVVSRSQTMAVPITSARPEPTSPIVAAPPVPFPRNQSRNVLLDLTSGGEQCQGGRAQK
jgi:hypothetical protein